MPKQTIPVQILPKNRFQPGAAQVRLPLQEAKNKNGDNHPSPFMQVVAIKWCSPIHRLVKLVALKAYVFVLEDSAVFKAHQSGVGGQFMHVVFKDGAFLEVHQEFSERMR